MKYKIDHDFHIHTWISPCSGDKEQTPEFILGYAKENGFDSVCITDHFWDNKVPCVSSFYRMMDMDFISRDLPLPVDENVKMHFGAETEMYIDGTLAIADETFDKLDFVVIPTTHLHMVDFTISEEDAEDTGRSAAMWIKRFEWLLEKNIPFKKCGIAHLTDPLIMRNDFPAHLELIDKLPESKLEELFAKSKEKGLGIELNMVTSLYDEASFERVMRPYRIAKYQGCKFYLGSDAHHPAELKGMKENFARMTEHLGLEESDKFRF